MISTHILDTCSGTPAAGVSVKLLKKSGAQWTEIAVGVTNEDGRFVFQNEAHAGIFQIAFEVEAYFKKIGKESFFVSIPVIFKIEDTKRKYHVPLLLNPFGFSSYRGS